MLKLLHHLPAGRGRICHPDPLMGLLESLGLSHEQSFVFLLVLFVVLIVIKKWYEWQG